jgi:phosphoenolpyruvate-protein phosphotransferase (PTS system enzyme I)
MADQDWTLRGTAVSSGVARGTAYVLARVDGSAAALRSVEPSQIDAELARFEAAVGRAEQDLRALEDRVAQKLGASEGAIFAAQALIVRDPSFVDNVAAFIRQRSINAEGAVAVVIDRFTRRFDEIADPYLRERAADIRDVGRRLLAVLIEEQGPEAAAIPEGAIVVADELLPSITAHFDLDGVRAFVTERGGRFSHAAILARSQGTPAVAGVAEATLKIESGNRLIVDGVSGVVFVNPTPAVEREYQRLEAEMESSRKGLSQLVDLASTTVDGTDIALLANVNKFSDTEPALLVGAQGIGLYRTEFAFTVRKAFPTEDEQYEFLARAAERFHPRKVVFRLLDIGADKELPYFPLPATRNPSLGQRGIPLRSASAEFVCC